MDRNQLTKLIGANIRKYRLKIDVSQESLSLSAGINPAYVGRLERGEKCPTIDTLYKICSALEISVCEILNFEPDTKSSDTQAKIRIENALKKLPDTQQIKIAEIIENIADLAENK
ncbi:MAG: helix-turn-helix transcriptional regulator [Ruminococcus sp.]|nr:helix-turn-helix transcriptional regulator [Ruminococcus sp.]